MKRLLVFLLVFVLLFASCSRKEEEYDLNLLTIPEGTPTLILNPHTFDVNEYERDDEKVEALLEKINELTSDEITGVDYIELEAETPFVNLFIEREETYTFYVWSMGEGKCAARLTMVGQAYDIYVVTFESDEIAALVQSIYESFEG